MARLDPDSPGNQARLGYRRARYRSPANPLGARAIYLYQGNKDTLYRIRHQPAGIYRPEAISSGCIRMTNEDVIDLYDRVKPGAIVVVLPPSQSALVGRPGPGFRG
jgi:lipoprotein-anchoring transpeptidase ErfK/SrfK